MNNTKSISVSVLLLACSNVTLAQTKKPSSAILVAKTPIPAAQEHADELPAALDAGKTRTTGLSKLGTNDNRVGR